MLRGEIISAHRTRSRSKIHRIRWSCSHKKAQKSTKMIRAAGKLLLAGLFVAACVGPVFAQTAQVRLKLADGSYMDVDEASETPQGVWYRKGNLNHLLPKEKVKKIERVNAEPAQQTEKANDDDHFEVPEITAQAPPT